MQPEICSSTSDCKKKREEVGWATKILSTSQSFMAMKPRPKTGGGWERGRKDQEEVSRNKGEKLKRSLTPDVTKTKLSKQFLTTCQRRTQIHHSRREKRSPHSPLKSSCHTNLCPLQTNPSTRSRQEQLSSERNSPKNKKFKTTFTNASNKEEPSS